MAGRTREAAITLGSAAVIIAADQLTKALVVANLAIGDSIHVVGDVVQIWHQENRGASFSLFQGGQLLFLAATILALGLLAYFFRSMAGRSGWFFLLLGLTLGGALGNFVDRLFRGGAVVDFVSVGFGDTRFPTFNVADSALNVGIIGFIVLLFFADRSKRPARPGERAPDAPHDPPG